MRDGAADNESEQLGVGREALASPSDQTLVLWKESQFRLIPE
jgi:hypothetical protein